MIFNDLSLVASDWQQQAYKCLLKGSYTQAAVFYEEAIAVQPDVKYYYWQLGLILLLQGQEVEAQTTWLLAMAEGESEEIDLWTQELIEVLQAEADRRLELADYAVSWAIRQHIREISPTDINNLLHLIGLSTVLGTYTGEELTDLGLLELLNSEEPMALDFELLMQVLKNVLDSAFWRPSTFEFTEACLAYVKNPAVFFEILIPFVYNISYSAKQFHLAARFTELGLRLEPHHPELLRALSSFYQDTFEFDKGIDTAKLCYSIVKTLADKVYANLLIMRGLMSAGGHWDEFCAAIELQKAMLASLINEQPTNLDPSSAIRLFNAAFFFPYLQDRPKENTEIRNQIARICQLNIEKYAKEQVERFSQRRLPIFKGKNPNRPLKIGYISYCFRTHSVGWLARWVMQHHNSERFEVTAYLLASAQTQDSLQEWYVSKVNKAHKLGVEGIEIAEKIYEDEIDILIDLDSITLTTTCEIMATKAAPLQITWLGWDAS